MNLIDHFRNAAGANIIEAGEVIFTKGDSADCMYVVLEGEVYLVVDDEVMEVAGPGDIFGEMGVIESQPRGGGAYTKTACKLLPIDGPRFHQLIQQTPAFAVHVMQVLSRRLRHTTQQAVR